MGQSVSMEATQNLEILSLNHDRKETHVLIKAKKEKMK